CPSLKKYRVATAMLNFFASVSTKSTASKSEPY
ncbi:MAG: hypothetical protein ACI8YQ_005320, partial [Polaribacter sp.]